MDWKYSLFASALIFGITVLWRVRPRVGRTRAAGIRTFALLEKAVAQASPGPERARAMCALAEAYGTRVTYRIRAYDAYQGAIREAPEAADILESAARTFPRRPRDLVSLHLLQLGQMEWGSNREAVLASLRALIALYNGPLKNTISARAWERALSAYEKLSVERVHGN